MLFDQYSRYRALALACKCANPNIYSPLLNEERGSVVDQKIRIYDIGSGPYKLLGNFLPDCHISYVDPLLEKLTAENSHETIYPIDIFKDFDIIKNKPEDIVVCIDTFEHIPTALRTDFLDKLCTLTKDTIILAFPYSDHTNPIDVDNHVNSFFNEYFGRDYFWLKEHREYGLPSALDTIGYLKDRGFFVNSFYQGNCDWLKKLLPTIIALNEINDLSDIIEEHSEFFNEKISKFDLCENGYRIFIIATKKEISLNQVEIPSPELIKKLEIKIEEISNNLSRSSLYKALAILKKSIERAEIAENKSLEMGRWGQSLALKVDKLESEYSLLQSKSEEVGKWGQSLEKKLIALEKEHRILQEKSHEIGIWAQSLNEKVKEFEAKAKK